MSIELPKDAEGREIPLDTEVLYDSCGTKVSVKEFLSRTSVENQRTGWTIKAAYEGNIDYNSFRSKDMHLTQPDTWERLEEDIRRIGTDDCTWFCGYANENPVENVCPDSCKFFKGDEITCRKKLADDILSRIRKLRGESE